MKVCMFIRRLLPYVGLVLFFITAPALAQQGTDFATHADGHLTRQLGAGMRFMTTIGFVAGLIVVLLSGYGMYLLGNDKGPQQLQQTGWKGPIIGLFVGGLLVSLPWTVGSGAATATGDGFDTDTWQRLQGQIEAPVHYVATTQVSVNYRELGNA